MEIRIDPHTLERAAERGASEAEIKDVVYRGFLIPATGTRLGKARVYNFRQERNNRYYEQKRVEVIYVLENEIAITVTVYVFYGKWEAQNADSV